MRSVEIVVPVFREQAGFYGSDFVFQDRIWHWTSDSLQFLVVLMPMLKEQLVVAMCSVSLDKIRLVEKIIGFIVCLGTVLRSFCGMVTVFELYLLEWRVVSSRSARLACLFSLHCCCFVTSRIKDGLQQFGEGCDERRATSWRAVF